MLNKIVTVIQKCNLKKSEKESDYNISYHVYFCLPYSNSSEFFEEDFCDNFRYKTPAFIGEAFYFDLWISGIEEEDLYVVNYLKLSIVPEDLLVEYKKVYRFLNDLLLPENLYSAFTDIKEVFQKIEEKKRIKERLERTKIDDNKVIKFLSLM